MKSIEYNGRTFKSVRKFCDVFHIDYKTTMQRINRGWSVNDCIIGKRKHGNYSVSDHNGYKYPSVIAMCRAYNVEYDYFCEQRRNNRKLSEILE